jgi:hypothetical protein
VTSADPVPSRPLPEPTPQRRGPARLVVLGVLALVLVASLVVLAVGLVTRAAPALGLGLGGDQQQVQREREDAMAQAEQFMLRVNTYGPDLLEGTEMPKYRSQVTAVITPKFATDFEKNVPAAEATVAQGGLARTATVLSTGVSTIDDDSATVLVAGSFTNSYPEEQGSTKRVTAPPSSFRVEVKLAKIKGEWLVDDFDPVTGLDDQQTGQQPLDPSSVPSLDPSTLPSSDASADPTVAPSAPASSGAGQ